MADGNRPTIEVEIVYALPDGQFTQTLRVLAGATIGQAIEQSDLLWHATRRFRRLPQWWLAFSDGARK